MQSQLTTGLLQGINKFATKKFQQQQKKKKKKKKKKKLTVSFTQWRQIFITEYACCLPSASAEKDAGSSSSSFFVFIFLHFFTVMFFPVVCLVLNQTL